MWEEKVTGRRRRDVCVLRKTFILYFTSNPIPRYFYSYFFPYNKGQFLYWEWINLQIKKFAATLLCPHDYFRFSFTTETSWDKESPIQQRFLLPNCRSSFQNSPFDETVYRPTCDSLLFPFILNFMRMPENPQNETDAAGMRYAGYFFIIKLTSYTGSPATLCAQTKQMFFVCRTFLYEYVCMCVFKSYFKSPIYPHLIHIHTHGLNIKKNCN